MVHTCAGRHLLCTLRGFRSSQRLVTQRAHSCARTSRAGSSTKAVPGGRALSRVCVSSLGQSAVRRAALRPFSRSCLGQASGPSAGEAWYDEEDYDVVVVGGGHAGCEAALAAARLGCKTLMLTLNLDRIAWQPCNPAVGGPAKSQLVHEVDALGGEMGKMADRTYVQKRVLNMSKGPAVWALRAQTDKLEYARLMRGILEATPNLALREGMAVDVELGPNDQVTGVKTLFGLTFKCRAAVLTTGTFMNGRIWVGRASMPAGRAGEGASTGLTEALVAKGFETARLKTGTPARVDSRSCDFSGLQEQPGDATVRWFSFDPQVHVERPQMSCYLTRTTEQTHRIIRDNLAETPKYGGWMDAAGPRYCPSIEDKIVRFADKDSHQIFLEPEGRDTNELYVQGFSTGLPERLQLALLHSLPGLEKCKMLRPAYAVEYDFLPAYQCSSSLETKRFQGLFFSGQLNGTTGYEEAAAQGIVAGLNAARRAQELSPMTLSRDSSYIGTLLDDLVTKDLREPYRMLTSRTEFRLTLRSDNADMRLTPLGREVGLVDDARWQLFQDKKARMDAEYERLASVRLPLSHPLLEAAVQLSGQGIVGKASLDDLIKRAHVHYSLLEEHGMGAAPEAGLSWLDKEALETELKYAGVAGRQAKMQARMTQRYGKPIPLDTDYANIATLSLEAREKLALAQPANVGQAARLGGVSPADIDSLLIHMEVQRRKMGVPRATVRMSTRQKREALIAAAGR